MNNTSGKYTSYMVKWGRITNIVAMIIGFAPALTLLVFYGFMPNWQAVFVGLTGVAVAIGVGWFTDPIATVPVLGVPGTMMGYLTGNVNNLRIPCSVIAQEIAETEPGTAQAEVISVLGMAVSVFVNLVVVAACAIGGMTLVSVIPENVSNAFNYMLPAVFGAVFMQFGLKQPRMVPICLGAALLIRIGVAVGLLPSLFSNLVTLICVILCVWLGIEFYNRDKSRKS